MGNALGRDGYHPSTVSRSTSSASRQGSAGFSGVYMCSPHIPCVLSKCKRTCKITAMQGH